MCGGHVEAIVTDQVHADPEAAQGRIVQRRDLGCVRPGHEHIAGSVVGFGRRQHRRPDCRAGDQIAVISLQGVADEAAPLRPPYVGDVRVKLLGNQRGDLVLKAFEVLVREGQIIRIGAYAQLACVRCAGRERHKHDRDRHATAGGRHKACLPSSLLPSNPPWR